MIVKIQDGEKPPTLAEAQEIVGGYVEIVQLPNCPGIQMLVNEEGLIHRMEFNPEASDMAGKIIVGPALILIGTSRWV